MNYLAHLYLAEGTDESLLGNLLGDFVKGRLGNEYNPEICEGIKTHRKVDAYTDAHHNFLACKKLLRPDRRRFAGIIVDLSFDHFLAKNWSDYSELKLSEFTDRVYSVLLSREQTLPQKLRERLPYMVKDDWLGSYKNLDTIGLALHAISKRLSRFEKTKPIKDGLDDIKKNYQEFEQNFSEFFPDLITFVDLYRKTTFETDKSPSTDLIIK